MAKKTEDVLSIIVNEKIKDVFKMIGIDELVSNSLQALIDEEASEVIGAQKHERSETRKVYRNGTRPRKIISQAGELNLKIPKLREGSFYPETIIKYQRVDRALIYVIYEAYINGVSTRKMEKLFKSFGISGLDKSTVSRLIQPIAEEIEKWKNRELQGEYIYVWLDGIYTKIRENGRVRKAVVLIAIGLRADGHREILGLHLNKRESYYGWKDLIQNLKQRGLINVGLWIRDQHDGLEKAIGECYPGQLQQRCLVHFQRNAFDKLSPKDMEWFAPLFKILLNAQTNEASHGAWSEIKKQCIERGLESFLDWLEESEGDLFNYLTYPESHWSKIRTTNPIERLNEEIRRREKSIRIFPHEKSCLFLIGSILVQQSESWENGRIYISNDLDKSLKTMNEIKIGQRRSSTDFAASIPLASGCAS
jgi:putative transposase